MGAFGPEVCKKWAKGFGVGSPRILGLPLCDSRRAQTATPGGFVEPVASGMGLKWRWTCFSLLYTLCYPFYSPVAGSEG
jgi:hypothetical protein